MTLHVVPASPAGAGAAVAALTARLAAAHAGAVRLIRRASDAARDAAAASPQLPAGL
ncbi:hypothetical protein MSM1_08125 [Mycobacterium sp. SM1]|uniref:hypothetical protein n=1 Tax=Mycobacterium sp. SM1 TaxID=2816243 RepID=UPI001BCA78AF|nr:hypothetical protein [Mycobacterium sp. SM1]